MSLHLFHLAPLSAGLALACLLIGLTACSESPWNNPYRSADSERSILYSSFPERPKHLDPVSSYSENEALFTGQIYEPVVQYHFLKRPYQLVPLTALALPEPRYFSADGRELPAEALQDQVASTVYRIEIRPGIRYQPHPALARNDSGGYLYHAMSPAEIATKSTIADFAETGTRELTAEDYVYQIKRLVHPQLHSPIAGLMGRYIVGLDALGQQLRDAQSDGASTVDLRSHELAGARVIDRYTYEITLSEKYPQFRYWLAMSFFAPVPWEADNFYGQPGMKERNLTLDWYPIGTGPYMLIENNPNRRMILQRNPNFHGEVYPDSGEPEDKAAGYLARAGLPMPFVDTVYYTLEQEEIPLWTKFLQGYYDVSAILSDSFDQAVQFSASGDAELTPAMREKGIKLSTAVQPSTAYLGFNMADAVVGGDSDRARLLRRAIAIAVDFEEFIAIFANGRGVPAQGPIPPGIFGYVNGEAGINPLIYSWQGDRAIRRSLDEARDLMRKAGYAEGRDPATGQPLTLYYETAANGPGAKSTLDWYRKQFAKLGIQLVVRATDYNRFQEKVRTGTAQLFSWGWNADYPDPENFLFLLYGPNAKIESQGENAVNYSNPEFDALFVRMRTMADSPERQALIDRMLDILRRDGPWLWGFHPVGYSLYHAWYGNAKPNLMARNTLKYKTIDPEMRARLRQTWNRPVWWPMLLLVAAVVASAVPAWRAYSARQRAGAR